VSAPQGQPPPPPQQIQVTPISVEYPIVGESPNGKIAAMVIVRQPLGERFVFLATAADWERILQAGVDVMRQHQSGIQIARQVPWPGPFGPPNGHP
jgi:hypothetical protein